MYDELTNRNSLMFKLSLLSIRIKYVFILTLALMIVETLTSAFYNYQHIQAQSLETAETITHYMLQARLALLYIKDKTPSEFDNQFHTIQNGFTQAPTLIVYQYQTPPPTNMINISESLLFPNPADINSLSTQLFHHHTIEISTYLSTQHVWISILGRYSTTYYWQRALTYFIYNIAIIGILWLSFFIYRRYTLPEEMLKDVFNDAAPSSEPLIKTLQQQIQMYIDEKNLMLSALAHDIKTPLTEAMLRVELLRDQSGTEAIKNSLNKINQIVTSSLTYAKQPNRIKTTEVDVISLLESIVEQYVESDFQVTFNSNVEECDLPIELELFKRMVANLIENAKKYATRCVIQLNKIEQDFVYITFEDNGPGVPDKFLHLLGIPYFRVDQARSSNTGGTGLGLAIIKKIVELHKGEITFNNLQGGGFQACIKLDIKKLTQLDHS
jgi:signal transduction histidine kinase